MRWENIHRTVLTLFSNFQGREKTKQPYLIDMLEKKYSNVRLLRSLSPCQILVVNNRIYQFDLVRLMFFTF